MKKFLTGVSCILLTACLLSMASGCGGQEAAPTETPSPEPTDRVAAVEVEEYVTPRPDSVWIGDHRISWDAEELDLSFMTKDHVEEAANALVLLEKLRYVDLGAASEEDENALTIEDVLLLREANPAADFAFRFSLYGVELSTLDEELVFKGIKMEDEGAAVREILPCMTHCTYLDMDGCGVSNEAMAAIRDDFPTIKVVWFVTFGRVYGARTDATKILASDYNRLNTENTRELQYFTDLKYLDLGHNHIDDISFVSYMPELEVAILALNDWSDCSPLANCTNLEYLEIFTTQCSDISPLAGLTNLRHLNIVNLPELEDITPLYGLTGLERLWLGRVNKVPQEQKDAICQLLPDCEINLTAADPGRSGWRDHPRYQLLRRQLGYDKLEYTYDPNR